MPVMDGLTATKAIRALNRPDAGIISIIAMTANAFAEDVQRCLDAGMNAHLAKPLDIEKVKKTICEHTIELYTINEQISNFAQTYPTNLKASSNEALLFMRRYRFANCSCFSCCFKDAYPSSNVQ